MAWYAAAALLLGFVLGLLLLPASGPPPGDVTNGFQAMQLSMPRAPVKAPPFTLKDPAGHVVELQNQRGKVVFLNFWATWCPPCRAEMPAMEKLQEEFKSKGLVVLAVSVNESRKEVVKFLKERKISLPVALDSDGTVSEDYGVRALPTTFLIGRDGEVLAMGLGIRDWTSARSRSLFRSLLASSR